MRANDFDLSRELSFQPGSGLVTFRESRLVIFSSDAMGLLRQMLGEQLGVGAARQLILRFGFQHGYSDFLQMKLNYSFDSEMDLLASGPVLHSWEGLVHASPREICYDRASGEFHFTGVWTHSYEAEQHLTFHEPAQEPVCWSLMGYASGWCTAFFGRPLVAIEPTCVGCGDEHCGWDIRPPAAWGEQAAPYLEAYEPFFGKMAAAGPQPEQETSA